MKVSENRLKWLLRFYPPLLMQRIWTEKFYKDFRGVKVTIFKSILNRNYNRSIFGGTVFAATDPYYPVLFHQLFTHKGYKVIAWSKSAEVLFLKPGMSNLSFELTIPEAEIAEAEEILNTAGKFTRVYPIDIYNNSGEICATVKSEIYLRNLNFIDHGFDHE